MKFKIKKLIAKNISYSDYTRNLDSVEYIVIHYTGNSKDTAENNARYFATSNTRQAGAHYFVDKYGKIYKSVELNRAAWSVGGGRYSGYEQSGGASCYGKCSNSNSVSIELCDCIDDSNWEQTMATRWLVKKIRKKCKNAKHIIRHWDVNAKGCPAPMIGKGNYKWNKFKRMITDDYSFHAEVIKKSAVRKSAKMIPTNIVYYLNEGQKVQVIKTKGDFAKIKDKKGSADFRWINLNNIRGYC